MMILGLIKDIFSFTAPYAAIGVLTTLTAVAIFRKAPEPDKKFLVYVFAISMVIRCYLSVLLTNIAYLDDHNGFVSGDDRLYSLTALDMIKSIKAGTFKYKLMWFGMNLYTYILAGFYSIFGFKLTASKLINCYIGSIIPIMTYILTVRVSGRPAPARIASLICMLYPSFIFWSTHNLKEPLIILSVCMGLWLLTKTVARELRVLDILIFAIFSFMILNLQLIYSYLAGMIILGVFGSYCSRTVSRAIAIALFMALGMAFFWKEGIVMKFLLKAEWHQWDMAVSDIAGYRTFTTDFVANIRNGYLDIPLFIYIYLKGLLYFLFSPLPWRIQTLGQFFVLPQLIIWYALFALSLSGVTRMLRNMRRQTVALIIFFLIGVSLWAFTEGNIGAAFRHRDHFGVITFIYAAIGIQRIIDRCRCGKT